MNETAIDFRVRKGNYIDIEPWDAIIHQCLNLNGVLVKPPLKLGDGLVLASHMKIWIHALILVNLCCELLQIHPRMLNLYHHMYQIQMPYCEHIRSFH